MGHNIIIAGASGLVGNHFIRHIAQIPDIDAVYSIGRGEVKNMPSGAIHYKTPIDKWRDTIIDIGADIACCCLGTTIKKAGSQEAFAAVDLHLVTSFMQSAKLGGAKRGILISSTMANAASKQFYLKTKGQTELAVKSMKFDRTDIIRPGLLRGDRNDDPRFGERLAIIASPMIDLLLHGKYRKFRSISAEDVAIAMANVTQKNFAGYHVHENDDLQALVKR